MIWIFFSLCCFCCDPTCVVALSLLMISVPVRNGSTFKKKKNSCWHGESEGGGVERKQGGQTNKHKTNLEMAQV